MALMVVLVVGCTSDGDPAATASATAPAVVVTETAPGPATASTPTEEPTSEPSDEPTEEPTEDATAYPDAPGLIIPEGSVATCELAGPEFCQDSNGNFFPDFVDEQLGLDPTVLPCRDVDCPGVLPGDATLEGLNQNTLFILDASGSMAGQVGGETKMAAAKAALVEYVSITPELVDIGLVVYGHQGDNTDAGRAESCAGVETFAEIGELSFDTVEATVAQFEPTGWTPIATSLESAGPLLTDAVAADAAEGIDAPTNRVVLISDGLETCDGDPVAAAQSLIGQGIDLVVDVIGFDIPDADRSALEQVATVTGGTYSDVGNGDALRDALDVYSDQFFAAADAINCRVEAVGQTTTCGQAIRIEGRDLIRDLAREAGDAGDADRERFLTAWGATAQQENLDAEEAYEDEILAELEEYRALIQDALARREELRAGGSKVAAAPASTCPLVPHADLAPQGGPV
ncbi:VWA domain-containing protein [Euzebya tangerina]|uniref:VWA domain-containing protein n=1 Tax=Euzebya tangerina TaxID=591198 RepID=UPI000E31877F|nr:VWA domain-containing protein [Euzebya tangerina]